MTRRTLALLACLLISGCALPSLAVPRPAAPTTDAVTQAPAGDPALAAPPSATAPADAAPTDMAPAEAGPDDSGAVTSRTSTVLPFDQRTTIDGLTVIVHRPVAADDAFRRKNDLPTVRTLFTVEILNDPRRPVDLGAYTFMLFRGKTQVRLDEAPFSRRSGPIDRQGHILPGGTHTLLVALETDPADSYTAGLVKSEAGEAPRLLAVFTDRLRATDTHLVDPSRSHGLTFHLRGGASFTGGQAPRSR